MMKALVGSTLKVTGSRTATVRAGPMPGNTPMAVPMIVPRSAHARCGTVSALAEAGGQRAQRVGQAGHSTPDRTPAGSGRPSTRSKS